MLTDAGLAGVTAVGAEAALTGDGLAGVAALAGEAGVAALAGEAGVAGLAGVCTVGADAAVAAEAGVAGDAAEVPLVAVADGVALPESAAEGVASCPNDEVAAGPLVSLIVMALAAAIAPPLSRPMPSTETDPIAVHLVRVLIVSPYSFRSGVPGLDLRIPTGNERGRRWG